MSTFIPLFPHMIPLAAATCFSGTGRRTVYLFSVYGKVRAAEGTGTGLGNVTVRKCGFQCRGKGQDSRLEIAAVMTGLCFVQHVAGTVKGQASVIAPIIGAVLGHQPVDGVPFGPGQVTFSVCVAHGARAGGSGPDWPEVPFSSFPADSKILVSGL